MHRVRFPKEQLNVLAMEVVTQYVPLQFQIAAVASELAAAFEDLFDGVRILSFHIQSRQNCNVPNETLLENMRHLTHGWHYVKLRDPKIHMCYHHHRVLVGIFQIRQVPFGSCS